MTASATLLPDQKLILRYGVRETLGLAMMGIALFWSAGRIDWWPAWAVLGVMLGWTIATAAVILRTNASLLAERLGPRKGAKLWDTAIMSLLGLIQLARYLLAGFDERFGWTADFPPAVQIFALILCISGYALFVWATASNAFFSQIVRIQPERGHTVATSGPYRFIRHPGYLGSIVFELAVPFLLASWWSGIASLAGAALLILRTALEDHTLQSELAGYLGYVRKVPYRLIPGLW